MRAWRDCATALKSPLQSRSYGSNPGRNHQIDLAAHLCLLVEATAIEHRENIGSSIPLILSTASWPTLTVVAPPGDNAVINSRSFVMHPDVLARIEGDDAPRETAPLESLAHERRTERLLARRSGSRCRRYGRCGRTESTSRTAVTAVPGRDRGSVGGICTRTGVRDGWSRHARPDQRLLIARNTRGRRAFLPITEDQ
jgi:hypothetical protein